MYVDGLFEMFALGIYDIDYVKERIKYSYLNHSVFNLRKFDGVASNFSKDMLDKCTEESMKIIKKNSNEKE